MYGTIINESQSEELESVQAKCLQIVRGRENESYARNLIALELESLSERRIDLIKTFAIACYKSEEHRWWFTPHPPLPLNTRITPPRFLVPYSRKQRDKKRPVVSYTEILNNYQMMNG